MTAEFCLANFVSVFVPETGPEKLCFDMAKRLLASGDLNSSR